ncbi:hypothetical protein [Couchioplanes caeruleus]|uniref:Uncharacterized protein n=2 Tax=Couchioplanes caeruleus TaxID=56438 RepID=A0A1K0GBC9_9ACTN|nr:hypothetical protein [Couchioplanes caeruleus]OJF09470.1 hypothetical protein BG844_37305 [Couchioplanes caeruleus subsp. caeruleus]ROP31907.1 hypothetical protein EDD30_4834 [Couchioplanes caeruleus]
MLIQELLPLVGDAKTVVEVSDSGETLKELLRAPASSAYRKYVPGGEKMDPDTVVVAFVGPRPETHVDAETVAPALRELPVGGRALLLLGWAVPDLPYHRLLDELVTAGCQVLQVVPLDKVSRHGAHCAVLAARVDRLAPLRTHLSDTPVALDEETPDLRALLRLTGEYVFGDLLSRPLRRKLAETADRVKEQDERIRHLEKEIKARDAAVTAAESRVARARKEAADLRASTSFRVGATVVQGARRPTRAIVSVPVGLVRIWRKRDKSGGRPGQ